ncbi:MAG: DUF1570 domain-containing protein [Planctomycetota bacterium]
MKYRLYPVRDPPERHSRAGRSSHQSERALVRAERDDRTSDSQFPNAKGYPHRNILSNAKSNISNGVYILFIFLAMLALCGSPSFPDESKDWKECRSQVRSEIGKFQYPKALSLLETLSKSVKDEKLKNEIKACIEDVQAEKTLFNRMIKGLADENEEKRIVFEEYEILITKADENGIEGTVEGVPRAKRWTDLPPKPVLELFSDLDLSAQEKFCLGMWCYHHNLVPEGERMLIEWLSANPDKKERLDRFISRCRDIPVPAGGFVEYKGQLVSAEDKPHLEKGLVNYKGRWMSYEEMMKSKGLVQYDNQWVTPSEKRELEAENKVVDELRKKYKPKCVINKPGADEEKLPWSKARVRKTEHFIITSNLSDEALDDLCFLMECYYLKIKRMFKVELKTAKLPINVTRTADEYYEIGGPRGSRGVYKTGSRTDAAAEILVYYQPPITSRVLIHETTHSFVHLACGSYSSLVPIWIDEGWTTYFECSRFDGNILKTNLVNNNRLKLIKQLISGNKAMPLDDFIYIQQSNYDVDKYAHGWSLMYFFINYNNGQYLNGINAFFGIIRKRTLTTNKELLYKAFMEAFKVKPEVLEEQWRDYIMKMEPAPEDEAAEDAGDE